MISSQFKSISQHRYLKQIITVLFTAWFVIEFFIGINESFARPPEEPLMPMFLFLAFPLVAFIAVFLESNGFREYILSPHQFLSEIKRELP